MREITDNRFHDNVLVFRDTEKLYESKYSVSTAQLRNTTTVYTNLGEIDYTPNDDMCIIVTIGDSADVAYKYAAMGHTAVLNFADAITPGGLVLVGESTQEEHLCRCSNLYASITTQKAYDLYYNVNAKAVSGIYTNRIIYSPNVLFFKDGYTYEEIEPKEIDVITCPAPSVKITDRNTEYSIIYRRIEGIIKSAAVNEVKNLILGAWGCGAFRQNPQVIANCFYRALQVYNAFDNVIFAIRDCAADRPNYNYDIFYSTLMEGNTDAEQ